MAVWKLAVFFLLCLSSAHGLSFLSKLRLHNFRGETSLSRIVPLLFIYFLHSICYFCKLECLFTSKIHFSEKFKKTCLVETGLSVPWLGEFSRLVMQCH